ncbi:MAG: AAA family ATPase, partial [Candidatus Aenigmarchaeota archaeon]|nr:AAA family ATPase [Candidatus Aenigmarchaeota archaeon]
IVIAATNRPDLIDPALLRPGRLDQLVAVPLPDLEARKEILKIQTNYAKLGEDVNLEKIADATENFSGADLEAVTREAMMNALRDFLKKYPDPLDAEKHVKELEVGQKYLKNALDHLKQRPTIAQVIKSKMQLPTVS